nr:hypothetical protein [Flavobacterium weaverense]
MKYKTDDSSVNGIDKFGESAAVEQMMEEYGFSIANVVKQARALLS